MVGVKYLALWLFVQAILLPIDALQVQVVDSSTGATISNAVCVAQSARTLKSMGTARSDLSGTCQFGGIRTMGHYTVQVSQLGYFNAEAKLFIADSSEEHWSQVQLSPRGTQNKFRVVLSWGDKVSDLDSYPSNNFSSHGTRKMQRICTK